MKLLVALILALAPARALAGECAQAPITAHPVAPAGGLIPRDGGIVVTHEMQAADDLDRGAVTTWRFGNRKPIKVTSVAPGLEVIDAADTTLFDARGHRLLRFALGPAAGKLEAPQVASIVYNTEYAGRRSLAAVVVELGKPATGFLVVYDKTGTQARSWGEVRGSKATVYSSGGCDLLPNGTTPSTAGDEVRIAWLDTSGRLSKLTPPIKIGGGLGQRPVTP